MMACSTKAAQSGVMSQFEVKSAVWTTIIIDQGAGTRTSEK